MYVFVGYRAGPALDAWGALMPVDATILALCWLLNQASKRGSSNEVASENSS